MTPHCSRAEPPTAETNRRTRACIASEACVCAYDTRIFPCSSGMERWLVARTDSGEAHRRRRPSGSRAKPSRAKPEMGARLFAPLSRKPSAADGRDVFASWPRAYRRKEPLSVAAFLFRLVVSGSQYICLFALFFFIWSFFVVPYCIYPACVHVSGYTY